MDRPGDPGQRRLVGLGVTRRQRGLVRGGDRPNVRTRRKVGDLIREVGIVQLLPSGLVLQLLGVGLGPLRQDVLIFLIALRGSAGDQSKPDTHQTSTLL